MERIKTDKELLFILRDNIKGNMKRLPPFFIRRRVNGLCALIGLLIEKKMINNYEGSRLTQLILLTNNLEYFKGKTVNSRTFYFPEGKIEPRIKYVDWIIHKIDQ